MPAAGDPADGTGDWPEPRAGRDHDRAPAVGQRPDGDPRRPAGRARQALVDPRPPPRAARDRQVGRRLAPRLRLRRSRGRGIGGQHHRRSDRRLDARQAAGPRRRRGGVPRPAVPEPLLEPEARPDPLRRDQLRRRPDRRRRHDLSPRRRDLLRHDDVQRRRRSRGVVLVVAGRLGARRRTDRSHAGPERREPRRSQGARDHGRGHRSRLLQRGVPVSRRQAVPPWPASTA